MLFHDGDEDDHLDVLEESEDSGGNLLEADFAFGDDDRWGNGREKSAAAEERMLQKYLQERRAVSQLEKNRAQWYTSPYGCSFSVLTGDKVDQVPESTPIPCRAADVRFARALYEDNELPIDELLQLDENSSKEGCGDDSALHDIRSMLTDPRRVRVLWPEDRLAHLTTADIQEFVVAALNSQRTLLWLIGVDAEGNNVGCSLTTEVRDVLCQAFDFALESQFVPELDWRVANIRFVPLHEDASRHLVVIEVQTCVEEIYQLSHGRVYYFDEDDKLRMFGSVEEAHRKLLALRRRNAKN